MLKQLPHQLQRRQPREHRAVQRAPPTSFSNSEIEVGLQAADFLAVVAFLAVLVVALRVAAIAVSVKAVSVKAPAVKALVVNVEAVKVAAEVVVSPCSDERGPSLVNSFAINCLQTERGHRSLSFRFQS